MRCIRPARPATHRETSGRRDRLLELRRKDTRVHAGGRVVWTATRPGNSSSDAGMVRQSGRGWPRSPTSGSPETKAEVPCKSTLRWRAATLSSDGWVSDWSAWSTLTIQPTAVPRLVDVPPQESCQEGGAIPLSWSVDPATGIAGYRNRPCRPLPRRAAAHVRARHRDLVAMRFPACDSEIPMDGVGDRSRWEPGQAIGPRVLRLPPAPPVLL